MALNEMRLLKTVFVALATVLIAKQLGRLLRKAQKGPRWNSLGTAKRFDLTDMDVINANFKEVKSRKKKGSTQ